MTDLDKAIAAAREALAMADRSENTPLSALDAIEAADALVAALDAAQAPPAAAVPPGYALVPVEPTEAMLSAARDWSLKKYGQAVGNDGARGCYAAMLAAAQAERAQGVGNEH